MVQPVGPAASTASVERPRSRPISTKSLKCPAWREASWRLSVKLSSLRAFASSDSSRAQAAHGRQARIVVAVLRPSGAERRQLAEVRPLPGGVGHAAAQAEPERGRDEVAVEPAVVLLARPGRRGLDRGRFFATSLLDAGRSAVLLDPVVGERSTTSSGPSGHGSPRASK